MYRVFKSIIAGHRFSVTTGMICKEKVGQDILDGWAMAGLSA